MGELARRRRARDLWISRSHLLAAAAGAVVLSVVSFGSGYLMGRGEQQPTATGTPASLTAGVPDDALVELLARVEATAARDGGVDALTFPEALRGEQGGGLTAVVGAEPAGEPVTVPAAEPPDLEGDPLPAGRYTIDVLRTASEDEARGLQEQLLGAGLDAFVSVELIDGGVRYRVGVGGYRTETAATQALAEVLLALPDPALKPVIGAI